MGVPKNKNKNKLIFIWGCEILTVSTCHADGIMYSNTHLYSDATVVRIVKIIKLYLIYYHYDCQTMRIICPQADRLNT